MRMCKVSLTLLEKVNSSLVPRRSSYRNIFHIIITTFQLNDEPMGWVYNDDVSFNTRV